MLCTAEMVTAIGKQVSNFYVCTMQETFISKAKLIIIYFLHLHTWYNSLGILLFCGFLKLF